MSSVDPPDAGSGASSGGSVPPPATTSGSAGGAADPAAQPAKKVVKKVVKKSVKKTGSSGRPPQAKSGTRAAAATVNPRTGQVSGGPEKRGSKSAKSGRSSRSDKPTRAVDPVDALLDERVAPPKRSLGADAQASAKGLLIIGLALVVGFVLLTLGYSRDGELVAGRPEPTVEPTTTQTTSPFNTTTSRPTATTPSAVLKDVSELTVQVANAGNLPGTPAGDATRKLSSAGYQTQNGIDAPAVDETVVYFADELRGEAEEVAKVLSISPDNVQEMPDPVPTGGQGVDILVMLGPEYSPTSQA